MLKDEKIKNFIKKIKKSKENDLDLSRDEDLSIAIMNLVSLEEHFFFTGAKTGQSKYYGLLKNVREIRKDLLKRIVKDPEGEEWCISKHLLSASMRLMEVGTKHLNQNENEKAEDLFNKAYSLYSLFWGINLKLIDKTELKDGAKKLNPNKTDKPTNLKEEDFNKDLNSLITKLVNCCDE